MSLKAKILALQERITWLDNMIRACQQSTGWEEAIKNAISRRDRWLDELKALTAEYTAATIAEHEAKMAAMKARHEAAVHEAKKAGFRRWVLAAPPERNSGLGTLTCVPGGVGG